MEIGEAATEGEHGPVEIGMGDVSLGFPAQVREVRKSACHLASRDGERRRAIAREPKAQLAETNPSGLFHPMWVCFIEVLCESKLNNR